MLIPLKPAHLLLLSALGIVAVAGCKKKPAAEAQPGPAVAAEANNVSPDPTANGQTAPPAPPKLDLKPVQTALKARDYDKATEELLLAARTIKNPTPDQNMAIVEQMHALQRSMAEAAAKGDPKAKLAIQRLEAGLSH